MPLAWNCTICISANAYDESWRRGGGIENEDSAFRYFAVHADKASEDIEESYI